MSDDTNAFTAGPRVPPVPPEDRDADTEQLLAALRRPEGTDLNIFATLAHHPKLLKRWAAFGGTLLFSGRLSPRDRELLILRTGYLCGAGYEWGQHVLIALEAGVSQDDIDRVPLGPDHAGWSATEAVLLGAVDELHHGSRITDATWAALAESYDIQQLIEICMVVGQYHLVAFIVNSLGVEAEPGLPELPR